MPVPPCRAVLRREELCRAVPCREELCRGAPAGRDASGGKDCDEEIVLMAQVSLDGFIEEFGNGVVLLRYEHRAVAPAE
ncbi:hypothetical protein PUR34_34035 [Streptomyces sp. JV185]|uniref:hypothetical protein n=1 Tax=Streptomyces sp. JV185 TaxID=858638 RepID=UPI002E75DC7C|nr:hypothetical protein [Streptomyces sp. JV185]MEE1773050.1 hypothetical protein [Streptomyces sp. JV185]